MSARPRNVGVEGLAEYLGFDLSKQDRRSFLGIARKIPHVKHGRLSVAWRWDLDVVDEWVRAKRELSCPVGDEIWRQQP